MRVRHTRTLNQPTVSLLLLLLLGWGSALPGFANKIAIDEDGDKNISVTIDASLIPNAQIKRSENQMVIQMPEAEASKMLVNPALKGKVEVIPGPGKKTVVTIHSGNIFLNIQNKEDMAPPVPGGRATASKAGGKNDPPVAVTVIPRTATLAKPPLLEGAAKPLAKSAKPPIKPANTIDKILNDAVKKASQAHTKSASEGGANPFFNPFAKSLPPQKTAKAVVVPNASSSLKEEVQLTQPTLNKNVPDLQVKEPEPLQEASEPALAAVVDPLDEGPNGIPLDNILPNRTEKTLVSSDAMWRTLASLVLVLAMLIAFVKVGLPRIFDWFPQLKAKLESQHASEPVQKTVLSKAEQKAKAREAMRANRTASRPTTPLPTGEPDDVDTRSVEDFPLAASSPHAQRPSRDWVDSIASRRPSEPSPEPDFSGEDFSEVEPQMHLPARSPLEKSSGARKAPQKSSAPKKPRQGLFSGLAGFLRVFSPRKNPQMARLRQEGFQFLNHLNLGRERDLYLVEIQGRHLVIAATHSHMNLITEFQAGEIPHEPLPRVVRNLIEGAPANEGAEAPDAAYEAFEQSLENRTIAFIEERASQETTSGEDASQLELFDTPAPHTSPARPPEPSTESRKPSDPMSQSQALAQWMNTRSTPAIDRPSVRKAYATQPAPMDPLEALAPAPYVESKQPFVALNERVAQERALQERQVQQRIARLKAEESPVVEAEDVVVLEDYDDEFLPS